MATKGIWPVIMERTTHDYRFWVESNLSENDTLLLDEDNQTEYACEGNQIIKFNCDKCKKQLKNFIITNFTVFIIDTFVPFIA